MFDVTEGMRRYVPISMLMLGLMTVLTASARADEGFGFPPTRAIATLVTAAMPTSTPVGGSALTDSATLTGRTNPGAATTATMTFRLYPPGNTTCTGPTVFDSGPQPVPATATALVPAGGSFTPTEPGSYRWLATYNGDANNVSVSGTCGEQTETVTVTKASPTIATTAAPLPRGALPSVELTDSATVTGRVTPDPGPPAKITFRLYGPNDANCSGAVIYSEDVPYPNTSASPTVTTQGGFTPTQTGTYRWVATYSGDTYNDEAVGVCGTASETTIVDPAPVTFTTTPSPATVTIAANLDLTDTVTVNRTNPSGSATVTFRLYGPNDANCNGGAIHTSTKNYNAGATSATSSSFTPSFAGTYRWQISYSGDNNNAAAVSSCDAANQTVVNKKTPTLSPAPSQPFVVGSGSKLKDIVTVLGRALAQSGATIDFDLYGPGSDTSTCTGPTAFTTQDVSVSSIGAPQVQSSQFEPGTAGLYRWKVTYSGDANNNQVTLCVPENETAVLKASPGITTSASSDIVLGEGTKLTDEATVGGGQAPHGTVTFRLYGPDDPGCADAALFTSTKSYDIPGDTITSDAHLPTVSGTYRWIATYNGDENNDTDHGDCNDGKEQTDVDKAQPTVATDASADGVIGSVTLTDEATVLDRFSSTPGASIEFKLWGPNNGSCTGSPAFTSTIAYPQNGGPVPSDGFSPETAGTYRWTARYTGDDNNKFALGGCNAENETTIVVKATPDLVTTADPATLVLGGGTVTASTVLSGRVKARAGATIDFRLYGPGNTTCTGTPVFTSLDRPVPQDGDPTVSVDQPFTPTKAGTYRWVATYSGDVNNGEVVDDCGADGQNVVVGGVTPTLTTSASADIVLGGGTLSDAATLTGRVSPVEGATVTFRAYGPDDTTCGRPPAFQSPAIAYPVAGGSVRSTAFTPTQAGVYRWIASYSGDGNNEAVDGLCGAPGEAVTVARSTATVSASPSPTITLGTGSMTDTASVSGRLHPVEGGVMDFRAYAPSDTTCSRAPVFQSLGLAYPVAGGPVTSAAFTPTRAGTYRWIATYRGDANNGPVATACGAANATTVAPGAPSQRVPNRAQTRKVTASTTPKRDRTKLYTFTTTGRVTPPPYCAPTAVPTAVGANCVLPICPADSIDPADCTRPAQTLLCSAGKVTIRFIRIAYTVSSRSVGLRPNCTFRSRVSLKASSPLRRGALTVAVRFEGNPFLLPRRASRHVVIAG